MGKVRTCDSRCHNAKGARCDCWCGGTFHGEKGAGARAVFRDALGVTELGAMKDPDHGQPLLDDGVFRAAFAKAVRERRGLNKPELDGISIVA